MRGPVLEIRAEMARQRLTVTALADAAGMSKSTLSRKLNGHGTLTLTEFGRVCEALGVSPSAILIASAGRAA